MFVGHYSVAFAAKSERNKIPLWVLFIAVQFLDYVWATLVLLGIEKLRVIKGFTAGSMLDSYFHPYSHSLIAALVWSVIAALVYKSVCSRHGCLYRRSGAGAKVVHRDRNCFWRFRRRQNYSRRVARARTRLAFS